ncbi:MAG: helix-turn-helix domain-containing protein, partial [Candidatus Sericytochromatia bacterium]
MTALSERIGVTPSYVSLLESGERQPSRDVVDKLADVFFDPKEINARDELRMLAGLSPVQTDKIIAPHDIRTTYEQMLEKDPHDFRTFAALVRVLLKEREEEQARQKIHEGLRRFTTSFQLQALLSQLELSHSHFQGAETAQRAAIEQFRSQNGEQADKATYADLYTSLGVIYYLWGSSQYERDEESTPGNRERALELFRQARQQYDIALEIAPEDVYLLDEYARLCFHLAQLSEEPERSRLWELSIRTFRKVICAENNSILGLEEIREACICMAQACSHAERFEEAELILVLTRSMSPDFWPAHYA